MENNEWYTQMNFQGLTHLGRW